MMVNCSSSCCSDGVWTNKQSDKQQSTSSNSASKTAQARQNCNGTIVIASPSWHNGGSIAAASAIQQVMVSQEHLFKNQQSTSDSSASKWEMITESWHSNGGPVATLAAQAVVTVPVWKSQKLAKQQSTSGGGKVETAMVLATQVECRSSYGNSTVHWLLLWNHL